MAEDSDAFEAKIEAPTQKIAEAWNPYVLRAVEALITERRVRVKTQTRRFEGRVWEIYKSPYGRGISGRVVDDEGRVHHFRIERSDCKIDLL
jgi:hypothetical protein